MNRKERKKEGRKDIQDHLIEKVDCPFYGSASNITHSMATEKVIQDSDDEDFEETPTSANPLQQSPPSRSNDGGVAPPEGSEEAHSIVDTRQSIDEPSPNVASSNGLDVNFDDFLQSQSSTKRASISPLLSRQAQAPAEIGQSSGMLSEKESCEFL